MATRKSERTIQITQELYAQLRALDIPGLYTEDGKYFLKVKD